ncbi:MAG: nitroreductase [Syntrophorhabdaceae bacterium]|nr:nitroreductase [Syntrophorhabdaceae bacterium]
MELIEAITGRKSIRAFKPDPVPKEKVEEILKVAINAPSAINLQPWDIYVVMGEERQRLSRRLIKSYREKKISCSPGNVKPLDEKLSARGAQSFRLMNPYLEEMNEEFNRFINEGSCNFYGAPVAIILCLDKAFSKARYVDIGILLGFIVLTAYGLGLGSCPIGLISAYEEDIKDVLDIPENKEVVIGIAMGYPDEKSPVNRFKSPREGIEAFVRWID